MSVSFFSNINAKQGVKMLNSLFFRVNEMRIWSNFAKHLPWEWILILLFLIFSKNILIDAHSFYNLDRSMQLLF